MAANHDINSRKYLEQMGGHGLKSSSKILQQDIEESSPIRFKTIDAVVDRDLERKKQRILPPMRNSLNLKMPLATNKGLTLFSGHVSGSPKQQVVNKS